MDNSDLLTVAARCDDVTGSRTLDVNGLSAQDIATPRTPAVDIIFLVDTSGSMSSELTGVKTCCVSFANQVLSAGINCRLGLVDFDKPPAGRYKWEIFKPMEPQLFPSAISNLRIGRLGGCGCYIGDRSTIRVVRAFANAFIDPNRRRIGVLVSDEVGYDKRAVQEILQILQRAGICLYVLGVPDSCHELLAQQTGGKFWNISEVRRRFDFSELLSSIAQEITNLVLR